MPGLDGSQYVCHSCAESADLPNYLQMKIIPKANYINKIQRIQKSYNPILSSGIRFFSILNFILSYYFFYF